MPRFSVVKWGQKDEVEMSNGFRDLVVWQKSMQLAVEVYKLTKDFPREEIYGLTSQIRRAAISVPSNIAEGQGRLNAKESRQFIGVARGSTYELQTQLELAQSLGFASSDQIESASKLSQEIGRMIHALVGSLQIPSA
jgi:four helix bundle protein